MMNERLSTIMAAIGFAGSLCTSVLILISVLIFVGANPPPLFLHNLMQVYPWFFAAFVMMYIAGSLISFFEGYEAACKNEKGGKVNEK